MKLCTTLADVNAYCKDWTEMIETMAQTPFRYLDFSFHRENNPGCILWSDNWMEQIKAAKESASRHGLTFVQAHAPLFNYEPIGNQKLQKQWMTGLIRCIEACGYLGIKNLVVHPCAYDALRYPTDMKTYMDLNCEFYSKLVPYMEKYRVNVLVENGPEGPMKGRCCFISGEEIKAFVTRFHHPLLHVCWDVGHANMRGEDQFDDLITIGSDLYALHIHDNFISHDVHLAPFMGTVNMDSIMVALKEIGHIQYFTFSAFNLLTSYSSGAVIPKRMAEKNGTRLLNLDKKLIICAEEFLYDIGKYILGEYNMFEE